jgi:hypothetical protein
MTHTCIESFAGLTPEELLSINGGAGTPNPGNLLSGLVSDLSTTVNDLLANVQGTVNDALSNLGLGSGGLGSLGSLGTLLGGSGTGNSILGGL